MTENEKFIRSFNFDINYKHKVLLILKNKQQYFSILPIELIKEIITFIIFRKKGFYYFIQDNSIYPNISNKYLGTIKSRCGKTALVSYNGWNDNFDEQVNINQISFLRKTQYPLYFVGDYLDILDKKTNLWFLGSVLNIEIKNNIQLLTILYVKYNTKEIIIANNIPIYYKYITEKNRHTYKSLWRGSELRLKTKVILYITNNIGDYKIIYI